MATGHGRVRHLFASGNTGHGFQSFFEYIAWPEPRRVFVLKGGPGTGKSAVIRMVVEGLMEKGVGVELFHCPSDPSSLDGVNAPELGLAVVDGTPPHAVEPPLPGLVGRLLSLEATAGRDLLASRQDRIDATGRRVRQRFQLAHRYLGLALEALGLYEDFYEHAGALDLAALDHSAHEIEAAVFEGHRVVRAGRRGRIRRLFASAVTPEGPRHYLDSLLDPLPRRVFIRGNPGTGCATLVARVAEAALRRGLDIEAYHCGLHGRRLDHVLIPELGVAVVHNAYPHTYEPKTGDLVIDTAAFVNVEALERYREEMEVAQAFFGQAFDQGIWYLRRALMAHQELEAIYATPELRAQVEAYAREILAEAGALMEEQARRRERQQLA
ncbi:AAA family ATPase [Thermaerobacter sp. PB12/4term]|nr:AAA family ATPase [Thermaerobacter sp. PB12/4term]